MHSLRLSILFAIFTTAIAQLSGHVGPTTSLSAKRGKRVCSILDHGAKSDGKTDIGPALASAFADCKSGGVVLIPSGNYALSTFVDLSHGSGWALQLDGLITRSGSATGGNMILISYARDFELFSSNSRGAMQGLGYLFHRNNVWNGPRLLRLSHTSDFSVHDIALADSPAFHLVCEKCSNGEIYRMAIRGANHGGTDGINVWGENLHVHNVTVTNKDECVTVKSPAQNVLVEDVYCNWSGGCAIGSLGADTAVKNIQYRRIYTSQANDMLMIKSNGGSGYVSDVSFTDFIGHNNAYAFDIDQYWSRQNTATGDGVQIENVFASRFHGDTLADSKRTPVQILCSDGAPCVNITLSQFELETVGGGGVRDRCRSAYGKGACLKGKGSGAYADVSGTLNKDGSSGAAPRMEADLQTHPWGTTEYIPVPQIPDKFFPAS